MNSLSPMMYLVILNMAPMFLVIYGEIHWNIFSRGLPQFYVCHPKCNIVPFDLHFMTMIVWIFFGYFAYIFFKTKYLWNIVLAWYQ